jgi:hypothetical protein
MFNTYEEWQRDKKMFRRTAKGYELFQKVCEGDIMPEEERLLAMKALVPEELLDFCLFRYEDEYCDQFTYETPLSVALEAGEVRVAELIWKTVKANCSEECYVGWINGLHQGHNGAGADGSCFAPLAVALHYEYGGIFTIIEAGGSLSTKFAYDDIGYSIFEIDKCTCGEKHNGSGLKKVLNAWRNCRAACFALLLASSRNPDWDKSLMQVIVQDYLWPTRKEIKVWQRTAATVKQEEKKKAVLAEKQRKRIIREKKKAECDAIKAGRAGGCEHHVQIDEYKKNNGNRIFSPSASKKYLEIDCCSIGFLVTTRLLLEIL